MYLSLPVFVCVLSATGLAAIWAHSRVRTQRVFWLSGCPAADPSKTHGSLGPRGLDCENWVGGRGESKRWRGMGGRGRLTRMPAVTQPFVRFVLFFTVDFRITEVINWVLEYSQVVTNELMETPREAGRNKKRCLVALACSRLQIFSQACSSWGEWASLFGFCSEKQGVDLSYLSDQHMMYAIYLFLQSWVQRTQRALWKPV